VVGAGHGGNFLIDALKEIIIDHIKFRRQLIKLARTDVIKTYRGTAFGWAWAIIKPAVTIFVFWFGFTFGIRSGRPINGYPFFYWMLAGFIPWFYMSNTLTAGAGSIRKYRYLVTRIKYPVDTIPTFVSMSQLFVNICLQLVMILIFILYGDKPTIYYLELPFYNLLMFMFFTAWSLFSAMLSAMSQDFLNLVKAVTTALFWMSGIMYDVNSIEQDLLKRIMLFNPVTICVNGFRNVLIYHRWFWQTPDEMRKYFIVLGIMCVLAVWAYSKLKEDIPDVL